jgi:prepilin-type N-terminal cleavage/methylation domain-containing protein
MKRFLNRIHRDNGGFTLIELLIVITIMGILAAVVLPSFTGVTHKGEQEAAATELAIVQTAMDTMMAVNHLDEGEVTAVTVATNDMTDFPDDTYPLYPNYLRLDTTSENYTCTDDGLVEQVIVP